MAIPSEKYVDIQTNQIGGAGTGGGATTEPSPGGGNPLNPVLTVNGVKPNQFGDATIDLQDIIKDGQGVALLTPGRFGAPVVSKADGSPVVLPSVVRRNIAGMQPFGLSGNLATDAFAIASMQAPGKYKAVQLIVYGQNSEGIRAAFSPSSIKGNLYDAKAANGTTALAPQEFTWGSLDPNDLNNRGGGKAWGTISDAVGTFSFPISAPYFEGSAHTDWMFVDSLPRVDVLDAPPMAFARWIAPRNATGAPVDVVIGGQTVSIPPGNATPGYRSRAGEEVALGGRDEYWPNLGMSYCTNNGALLSPTLTAAQVVGKDAVTGVISPTNVHYWNFTLRFLLDVPTITLFLASDSHGVGYQAAAGVPGPYGANGLGGFVSKLARKLVSQEIPAGYVQQGFQTDWSINFHQRTMQAIRSRLATHYFIQIRSVNDDSGQPQSVRDTRLARAQSDTAEAVLAATTSGAQPIVVQPWTTSAEMMGRIELFSDSLRSQGVAVLDVPAILCEPDRVTLKPEYVVSGDPAHFNQAAQDELCRRVLLDGLIK